MSGENKRMSTVGTNPRGKMVRRQIPGHRAIETAAVEKAEGIVVVDAVRDDALDAGKVRAVHLILPSARGSDIRRGKPLETKDLFGR